jgi:hypothetical protein
MDIRTLSRLDFTWDRSDNKQDNAVIERRIIFFGSINNIYANKNLNGKMSILHFLFLNQ